MTNGNLQIDYTLIDSVDPEPFFSHCYENLASKQRVPMSLNSNFSDDFPPAPGVYGIFEGGSLNYVGQSGDLNSRMSSVPTCKHTFVEKYILGNYFGDESLFINDISGLTVSHIELKIGRLELENWIIETLDPPLQWK